MTDPAGGEERRELERRAFGRDGSGLSEAEAARLAELRREDAARRDPVSETDRIPDAAEAAAPATDGAGSVADAAPAGPEALDGSAPVRRAAALPETGSAAALVPGRATPAVPTALGNAPSTPLGRLSAEVSAWLATGRWKRPRYLVGGLIALLLVGVLIGVAIPRPRDVGLALRAGEGERRDKVVEGADHDPGSVALLARSDHALLWYATQSRGDLVCAIIDVDGSPPQQNCRPRGTISERPLDVASQSEPGADGNVAGDQGVVSLSGTGAPMGYLQHWSSMMNPDPGLNPEETETWKRITSENGFRATMMAGRMSGIPVWVGYREQGDLCLVVEDGNTYKDCGQQRDVSSPSRFGTDEAPPTLVLDLPATTSHVAYRLEYWTGFSSYLVITANPDPQPTPPFGLKPAA
ncbi:hypothetical protein [Microbacterium sp. 13-71-7]|jgi:hypothetical protein|uniref:hypothetical protein n=1 Tax=Microbacterium sp. 13-71-7 TaxID=1970399 RepID=UPI000BC4C373|nr:hypothetical protein [Microbacterium sp. 13-71-7]OZB82756.1 MAG: hypothetical protein B7X32_12590 [Microbacterium sp. 13-71-7]